MPEAAATKSVPPAMVVPPSAAPMRIGAEVPETLEPVGALVKLTLNPAVPVAKVTVPPVLRL